MRAIFQSGRFFNASRSIYSRRVNRARRAREVRDTFAATATKGSCWQWNEALCSATMPKEKTITQYALFDLWDTIVIDTFTAEKTSKPGLPSSPFCPLSPGRPCHRMDFPLKYSITHDHFLPYKSFFAPRARTPELFKNCRSLIFFYASRKINPILIR